MKKKVVSES